MTPQEVATDYLYEELDRDDAEVAGVIVVNSEALVLISARHGDFALHLRIFNGEWAVVDELDDYDFYDCGGVPAR